MYKLLKINKRKDETNLQQTQRLFILIPKKNK